MRQVQSTPSGDLYSAMIRLGRKIGGERARRTMMSRNGYAHTEAFPEMVVFCDALVPAVGHLSLVLGFIVGAD